MSEIEKVVRDAVKLIKKSVLRKSRIIMSEGDWDDIVKPIGRCTDKSHSGFGGNVSQCPHPECTVRSVIEE